MWDNWVDTVANEILEDDTVASTVCPGFIEDWEQAVIDVARGRIPRAVRKSFVKEETVLTDEAEGEVQKKLIYPQIVRKVETEIGEIHIVHELFCPFCRCRLTLRQNKKTGVVFYGCTGFPHCRYSIGEKELLRYFQEGEG